MFFNVSEFFQSLFNMGYSVDNKNMANNRKVPHVAQQRPVQPVHNKPCGGASANVPAVTNAAAHNCKIKKKKIKPPFISKAKEMKPTTTHILIPTKDIEQRVGALVFSKYKGKYIQHKIAAIDAKKGFQLSRKGHINCWSKNIYSKVENKEGVTSVTTADNINHILSIEELV